MSYTSSSSTSSQAGISTSDSTSSSSTTYGTTLELSSPDDSDGLYAGLGGDAIAVGDDTLTAGSISAEMVDEGDITTLSGDVTMVAASQTTDESAFTDANTSAEVSDAGFVYIYSQETDSSQQNETGSTSTSISQTTVTAYDIDLSDTGHNTPSGDEDTPATNDQADSDSLTAEADTTWDLDGNFASVDFYALAAGDDSLVIVDAFALTIEDELSISAGYVDIAVD